MEYILQSIHMLTATMLRKLNDFDKNVSYNALFPRLKVLLNEMNETVQQAATNKKNPNMLKENSSIMFRNADMILEMNTMLKRTSNLHFDMETKSLQEQFSNLVPLIVKKYGRNEALYIVPPRFQRTSDLWS
jgi:hypothetical protein